MDAKACWQTKKTIDTCKLYDICYQEKNITFYETKEGICGPDGQLEQLKIEYYGVLRIECILKALRLNTYPAEEYEPHFHDVMNYSTPLMPKDDNPDADARMDAIDECVEKAMVDYEPILCPIFCHLHGCNMTEPIYNVLMHSQDSAVGGVGRYDRECEVARLPPSSLNMSGAAAYPPYWYDKVVPKNCKADCCVDPENVTAYKRIVFPRFLISENDETCDAVCATKNLTCSEENLRAHVQENDDCARMTTTMVDLGLECKSCQAAFENEAWTPAIGGDGICYTASKQRTVEQHDCTARASSDKQRVCWCQAKGEAPSADELQAYPQLAPEDDAPEVREVPALLDIDMDVV